MTKKQTIISLCGIKASTRLGITDLERSQHQPIIIDVRYVVANEPFDLQDDIEKTCNYESLLKRIIELSCCSVKKLLETLAQDICVTLTNEFGLLWIELKIKKFILPYTEYVAVEMFYSPFQN